MLWFSKKKEKDPDEIVFEKYKTDFGLFSKNRFPVLDEDGYSTSVKKGGLNLTLFRKNIFSWVPSTMFQYRDFVIESEFEFGKENKHSSCGFIFRFMNNENFYSFLISNQGMFRFDILFNGKQLHLIEWTACEHLLVGKNTFRIIGHSNHFSFFANDEWIAEFDDEKLYAGKTGITGQNYNETEKAEFTFYDFMVDSRPIEVEKAFYRWVKYIPIEPIAQIGLAQTLFSQGDFSNAAVLLKRALRIDPENSEAAVLFSECCINLRLYTEAYSCIEDFLKNNPSHREAQLEKANLLYLQNRFIDAKEYIQKISKNISDSDTLWNVLGNTEYALGNWDEAGEAYKKASAINPEIAISYINRARTLEQTGKKDEASDCYLNAAHHLFNQEAYTDLETILPRIIALKPKSDEVKEFQAKIYFHEDKPDMARPLLEELVKKESRDSAVYYLLSLLHIRDGKRETALTLLEKAVELSPEYPLYIWRLAESKRILGKEYADEIEKAKNLAPDDPWVNNLMGIYYIDQNDLEKAELHLKKSHEKLPQETDIIINLSEIYFLQGNQEKAFSLLEDSIDNNPVPQLYNQRGNIYARMQKYIQAVPDYEEAVRIDPVNPFYKENCAAACMEADLYTRADELLVLLLDTAPSPSVYNLLGNLAIIRGEFKRAELCFEEALILAPEDHQIKTNLAAFYTDKLDYKKAKSLVSEILAAHPDYAPAKKLVETIRKRFEKELYCNTCSRQWWAPQNPGTQELGKIVGAPPVEAPAGKCPSCGKIYCIGCAQAHLRDKRFVCPDCDKYLKFSDDVLRYLLKEYLEKDTESTPAPQKQERPLFKGKPNQE